MALWSPNYPGFTNPEAVWLALFQKAMQHRLAWRLCIMSAILRLYKKVRQK
jgi:hypothetical protein